MERTKRSINTSLPRWRMISKGSLRFGNKLYKPNELVYLDEGAIPEKFRHYFVPVDGETIKQVKKQESIPVKVEKPLVQKPEKKETIKHANSPASVYRIEPGEGIGWFNIVGPDGKKINESALRKAKAEELLHQLIG